MNHADALYVAEWLREELRPGCVRFEVFGAWGAGAVT